MKKLLLALLVFPGVTFAAGTLQVSTRDLAVETLPKNAVSVPFLSITLEAKDSDILVPSITVRRTGLSDSSDIGNIRAITSDYYQSYRGRFNTNDLATLRFSGGGLVIPQGKRTVLTVLANLEMEESGRTIGIELAAVDANAEHIEFLDAVEKEKNPEYEQKPIATNEGEFRIECKNKRCSRVPIQTQYTYEEPKTKKVERTNEPPTVDIEALRRLYRVRCRNGVCQRILRQNG